MKEQIREILKKATSNISSTSTHTYNCILPKDYDKLVNDLDELLKSNSQTKEDLEIYSPIKERTKKMKSKVKKNKVKICCRGNIDDGEVVELCQKCIKKYASMPC